MGVLERPGTTKRWPLLDRSLVGRSRACDVRLHADEVSGEHASIRWERGAWVVRDLGSRNGTWVGDHQLATGEAVRLAQGDRLRFASTEPWCLVDAGPPEPAARCDEVLVLGTDGILALPDAETPVLTIYCDGTGEWQSDGPEGLRPVAHGDEIVLDDRRYTVHLPSRLPPTAGELASTLASASLRFSISLDQEHVEVAVVQPQGLVELGARSHHEVLLQLARLRIADREAGLPPGEEGWVYLEALAEQLGYEPPYVNVLIFRARKQVARAEIPDAATIIERRSGTRQVRIGVPRLELASA